MNTQKKLFAFKLAGKQAVKPVPNNGTWKARDGIAIAQACTGTTVTGLRVAISIGTDAVPPC